MQRQKHWFFYFFLNCAITRQYSLMYNLKKTHRKETRVANFSKDMWISRFSNHVPAFVKTTVKFNIYKVNAIYNYIRVVCIILREIFGKSPHCALQDRRNFWSVRAISSTLLKFCMVGYVTCDALIFAYDSHPDFENFSFLYRWNKLNAKISKKQR